ncbi:hypothetical protein C343_02939 [Cryptococcus neoformans C23]|nr:hypothetical protein C343_02939 [Cryptococcus neoformans var. grubii C23]OWZ57829.1 hypothetical protein C368_00999 [Cryptococcus neoformans var. grubii 125.91]OXG50867.1 hypothetical protein C355_02652 [Cryptococcus neoformans var. grubii Th84]OXG60798.1 hypothetical protein C354_02778 [Cryptococcus neoformans var. grubii MW-RSA1955]OXG82509.1 hypothetical protein C350_02715 [Cryptococcus neoformans var. grubii MW-RSA36]OXG83545.1 hypothetical protein C349_02868 [Cryptococcus neoformans va
MSIQKPEFPEPPCKLFAITQYQCSPESGRVTCWPLERIFRQCGENKPVIEVTNRILRDRSGSNNDEIVVDPVFIKNPPKAKGWGDLRGINLLSRCLQYACSVPVLQRLLLRLHLQRPCDSNIGRWLGLTLLLLLHNHNHKSGV